MEGMGGMNMEGMDHSMHMMMGPEDHQMAHTLPSYESIINGNQQSLKCSEQRCLWISFGFFVLGRCSKSGFIVSLHE